jgi:hypothetical protein
MSIIYYTIKGKCDGFGAQYQAILTYKNYIYIHTPFIKMDHHTDINIANEFIGINNTVYDSNLEIIEQKYESEVHFSKTPSIYYTDKVLEIYKKLLF